MFTAEGRLDSERNVYILNSGIYKSELGHMRTKHEIESTSVNPYYHCVMAIKAAYTIK